MPHRIVCLTPWVLLAHIGTADADGCAVDRIQKTVRCVPEANYDRSKHDGVEFFGWTDGTKILTDQSAVVDGWSYFLSSTKDGVSPLGLYSNKLLFEKVDVATSGASADALILRNWGPSVGVNVFHMRTTGQGADGANIAREAQNGKLVVYRDLDVSSRGGFGIRAVVGHFDYSTLNEISSKGKATVQTWADASRNSGHAVAAGLDAQGCGPFGLPLFACRAVDGAKAEIHLLGVENTLRAHGKQAAAIYAGAKGYIRVGNTQIESTGAGAFGIRADRVWGRWYYDRNTTGAFDDVGTVDLMGHVTATALGQDAYAFHAGREGAAPANPAQARVARIRSFDRDSQLSVRDKVYLVNGDMRAVNSGSIDLWMADGSRFSGSTSVLGDGELRLGLEGADSVWRMNASASLTQLELRAGATLSPLGDDGAANHYTLQGAVQSEGIVDLSNDVIGDRLTLQPVYEARAGAALVLESCLAGSGAASDMLLIEGAASGSTLLTVRPSSGAHCAGADTSSTGDGKGILVARVPSDSSAVFILAGGHITHNAFVYRLVNEGRDWYLRSSLEQAGSIMVRKRVMTFGGAAAFSGSIAFTLECAGVAPMAGNIQVSGNEGSSKPMQVPVGATCAVRETLPANPAGHIWGTPEYAQPVPVTEGSAQTTDITNTLSQVAPSTGLLEISMDVETMDGVPAFNGEVGFFLRCTQPDFSTSGRMVVRNNRGRAAPIAVAKGSECSLRVRLPAPPTNTAWAATEYVQPGLIVEGRSIRAIVLNTLRRAPPGSATPVPANAMLALAGLSAMMVAAALRVYSRRRRD
ncbi:DUF5979 domain-containing protein [Diaphorobacter sp.]|uniref:DUF5979 domain-containing protein n=1 Tax=Diaphorobacter sp. TaxID=1934310 RepID=UPI0028B0ED08|nr:DUF5979 domain-containing protein [Diaphorobacter sp.]